MLASASAIPTRRVLKALSPMIEEAVQSSRADRYRKSFPARAHAWMLILHAMSANHSLRQSHAQQAADPRLRSRLGMEEWVSFSQLARSSHSRPSECFELLLASLVRHARSRLSPKGLPASLGKLAILDSTFFSLSRKLSPWSIHKGFAPGVRLQTELDLSRQIPTSLRLTLSETNDRTALKEWDLSELEGWTLVFDLGYYSHAHFLRLLEGGVSFLTRLHSQASYQTLCEERASVGRRTKQGDTILRDRTITLGSPNNRTGAVLENIRLVSSRSAKGEVHHLITDRHDLSAPEVVELYRRRWQIELFFRWLKRELGALRALGRSRTAVWLTILVAALVTLIAMLCEDYRPKGVSRVSWLRALWCGLMVLRFSG